jgi:hypothetical protein
MFLDDLSGAVYSRSSPHLTGLIGNSFNAFEA